MAASPFHYASLTITTCYSISNFTIVVSVVGDGDGDRFPRLWVELKLSNNKVESLSESE